MGLAGTIQIVGQEPKEQTGRTEGGLVNPGLCIMPCTLQQAAAGLKSIWSPPCLTNPSLFTAVVWPGLVQLTAKADGTLDGTGWA